MSDPQELVVRWRFDDGARCALFDREGSLELRIVLEHVVVRQQPVTDILYALDVLAPTWEYEYSQAKEQAREEPARTRPSVQSGPIR